MLNNIPISVIKENIHYKLGQFSCWVCEFLHDLKKYRNYGTDYSKIESDRTLVQLLWLRELLWMRNRYIFL